MFKKSSPLKIFWNILTSVKSFCIRNFADLLAIHIHMYHFLYIYLNISSNGVNFSTSTHRFHPVKFRVFAQKMKMQCTSFSETMSFFVIVCLSHR